MLVQGLHSHLNAGLGEVLLPSSLTWLVSFSQGIIRLKVSVPCWLSAEGHLQLLSAWVCAAWQLGSSKQASLESGKEKLLARWKSQYFVTQSQSDNLSLWPYSIY